MSRSLMKPSAMKKDARSFLIIIATLTVIVLLLLTVLLRFSPSSVDTPELLRKLSDMQTANMQVTTSQMSGVSASKRLIFYNRPPKTGSTTVRIAMKKALDEVGLVAAKCFNMIEWNEMGLKTIVNRRDVDFYGCHTRLTPHRYGQVSRMRNGNVTFITNTRNPENIILSAYLQANRGRKIADITDDEEIQKEIEMYKKHINAYPVDALYGYHGAGAGRELKSCPLEWLHEDAMRKVAERYEVVIDLERPEESAVMVEAVTGLKPDFSAHYNERTTDTSGKMLSALKSIDTSHRSCGNDLVHRVLIQQFNIIKDRLLQNRCFSEEGGTWEVCDQATLRLDMIRERTRDESLNMRSELEKAVKQAQSA